MKSIGQRGREMYSPLNRGEGPGHLNFPKVGAGALERFANGILAFVAVTLFFAFKTSRNVDPADGVATSCRPSHESVTRSKAGF